MQKAEVGKSYVVAGRHVVVRAKDYPRCPGCVFNKHAECTRAVVNMFGHCYDYYFEEGQRRRNVSYALQ